MLIVYVIFWKMIFEQICCLRLIYSIIQCIVKEILQKLYFNSLGIMF